MRFFLHCLALMTLPLGMAWGQFEQTNRCEFAVSPSASDDFEVTLLHQNGMLVTHRKDSFYGDETWYFIKHDTSLKELWRTEYKLDFAIKPMLSYHNDDFLYWLFHESDTEKFQILRLDLSNGETDVFKGNFLTRPDVSHFKVIGSLALIGGNWRDRPTVLAFSLFDNTIKALPHLYMANTEIKDIEVDTQRNEINVILYGFKKQTCQFLIKTYAYDGHLLRATDILSKDENALISGKILPLDDVHSLLVGNYAQGCTQYSQGLYFTRLQQGEPENLQWIDFSKLENFFNYLKPRRKQKVVERINKQKEEGRDPKFRYRMLVHDPIQTDSELILVAEVYYPVYHNAAMGGGFGVRPKSSRKERDYDAFRYTHAVVCGFDLKTGQLLWDNCFAIEELENPELVEMVQITRQNDQLVLGYPYKGKIHTEAIHKNKVIRESEAFEIKDASEKENRRNNDEEQSLAAWYDSYFLVYGFQKINLEKSSLSNTREVFFVNKLRYDINAQSLAKDEKKK